FAVGEGVFPVAAVVCGDEPGVEFEDDARGAGDARGVAAEAVGDVDHGANGVGFPGGDEAGGDAGLEGEVPAGGEGAGGFAGDPGGLARAGGGAEARADGEGLGSAREAAAEGGRVHAGEEGGGEGEGLVRLVGMAGDVAADE